MVIVEPGSWEMDREASSEEFMLWAFEEFKLWAADRSGTATYISAANLGPQPGPALTNSLRQHGNCSALLFLCL